MVHTFHSDVPSTEIKFLVDSVLAGRIRAWARAHGSPDPHGVGEHCDEYEAYTLYFDTAEFDVLNRRGSFARAKYRVRRYGNADAIFLERKLRRPGILIKRRIACPIDRLDLLNETDAVRGWRGEWFHRRLRLRCLRPVCQVSYRRMARQFASTEGFMRLTVDTELRVREADAARFSADAARPFLESQAIVELKTGTRVPALCRRLVEEFALTPHNASKYRLGMTWLGHGERQACASRLAQSGGMHA
jgi:hypothetical protein